MAHDISEDSGDSTQPTEQVRKRQPEQKNKDSPVNKRSKKHKEFEDGEVQEEEDFNRDMAKFLSNNGLSNEAKSDDGDSDDDWSDLAEVTASQFEMEDEVGADINEGYCYGCHYHLIGPHIKGRFGKSRIKQVVMWRLFINVAVTGVTCRGVSQRKTERYKWSKKGHNS